ncbi:MAG: hypothetical protein IIC67_05770 [Thaumarchaeota archaeon]|nr:hypothetical protein [Nitrososphaerota archaeon]
MKKGVVIFTILLLVLVPVVFASNEINIKTLPEHKISVFIRNVDQFVDGPTDYTGTLTFFPQDWRSVVTALGSNVDSGSPSPYIHTIVELNSSAETALNISGALNPFTSFTLEDSKTFNPTGLNFIRKLKGCNTDTWTLNGTQGEILTIDMDYIAQNIAFSSGTTTVVTEDSTRPFLWRDVQLHIPSGTVIAELKDFSLSISNNLEPPHYLNGSRVIAPPIPLNRDYELTATLDSTSTNSKKFYDQFFIGGSTFNMMLAVSASTGSKEAFFIMSGCKITSFESPSPDEGINEYSITIMPQTVTVSTNDLIEKHNLF